MSILARILAWIGAAIIVGSLITISLGIGSGNLAAIIGGAVGVIFGLGVGFVGLLWIGLDALARLDD